MGVTEIHPDQQIFPGSSNQVLGVNNAGTADEYKSLSGTTNEITVTNGVGTITLSTPQAIATSSSPTFAGETLTGNLVMSSNKITVLANGTASDDAVNFSQNNNTFTNILDNGGFEIWQRGTSFTNPGGSVYTTDRWISAYGGGVPTATVTREATTIDSGLYSFKYVLTATNSTTIVVFKQFIENYADYIGKAITFSCRIKSSVANSINIRINDDSGSTDSSTNVGTGFETLTVTHTVAAGTTSLNVEFGMRSVAAQVVTFYADSALLVLGSEGVTFVPTNPQVDLARCQRYFFKTFDVGVAPAQNTGSNLGLLTYSIHTAGVKNDTASLSFPVLMRAAPTITTYSPSAATANWYDISLGAASGVPEILVTLSSRSIDIRNPQVAGDTVGSVVGIHFTASADL